MAPFFFLIYFELHWFIHSFFIHLKIDWMPYFFDGMVETLPLISLHPLTDRRINTLSAKDEYCINSLSAKDECFIYTLLWEEKYMIHPLSCTATILLKGNPGYRIF